MFDPVSCCGLEGDSDSRTGVLWGWNCGHHGLTMGIWGPLEPPSEAGQPASAVAPEAAHGCSSRRRILLAGLREHPSRECATQSSVPEGQLCLPCLVPLGPATRAPGLEVGGRVRVGGECTGLWQVPVTGIWWNLCFRHELEVKLAGRQVVRTLTTGLARRSLPAGHTLSCW